MTPTRPEIVKALQEELEAHRSEIKRLEAALELLTPASHKSVKERDTRSLRTVALKAGQGPTRDWLRQTLSHSPNGMTPQEVKQVAATQHFRIPKNFPHKMLYEMKEELVNASGRYSVKKAND